MGVAAAPGSPAVVWTRYGRAAYDELRAVVAEAKASDPLAPVTLLVPTDLCGVAARRELARGGVGHATGVAALNVLTVARLAELLAAPRLVATGRRPLTGPVLAASWRSVLATDSGVFAPVADHPATVTALVHAHRQLRDLDDSGLDLLMASGPVTRDVVRLHRQVLEACRADWYDAAQLLDVACETVDGGAASRLGSIVMFLPQELSAAATRFAHRLTAVAPLTAVVASSGSDRADEGVVRTVERLGLTTVRPVTGAPTAAAVMHASDSDDEVRCIVRDVVSRLATTPAHKVAVLYGNSNPYARLLHEHLASAGVPINGPGVKSTAERTVPRAFVELLELVDAGGFDRTTLFGVLSGAPFRMGDGRLVPTSRWERLSRRAGVTSADTWRPRLGLAARSARAVLDSASGGDTVAWRRDRASREAEDADALLVFVEMLTHEHDRAHALTTWRQLSSWSVDLLAATLFGPSDADDRARFLIPEEDRRALETLERILSSLAGLDSVEPTADLETLREVVSLELADDITRVGRFGTGVLVAPVASAIGLDLDVVFVVGLAEGICPTAVNDDPLLPDDARLLVQPDLPASRDRLDRQQRALLAAFASATESVVSFPRGDLRASGGRIPSRWLLPTLRALSGDDLLAAAEWDRNGAEWAIASPSYATSVLSVGEPATETEWRQRALHSAMRDAVIAADTPLTRALELRRERSSSRFTRFDGNLASYAGSLPDLTSEDRQHSPTSLEQWVSCPHAYFVQRMLYVRPVEEPEAELSITPMERGNLMHYALDRFFHWLEDNGGSPSGSAPWTASQRDQLQTIASSVADELEALGVTGHPTLWARDRELILKDLGLFLDEDEKVRAETGRHQIHAELRFGGSQPPVAITLPGGRTIRLTGSIDRIDESPAGLVVVDYKSGGSRNFKGLSETDPDLQGEKLQLPVYGYAARQHAGDPTARVHAEYWFIGPRDRRTRIGYDLTPEVEARYGDVLVTIADGVAAGVFPHRPPEDNPWASWVECPYCDVDGLGAEPHRNRWSRKKSEAALAGLLALIEPETQP